MTTLDTAPVLVESEIRSALSPTHPPLTTPLGASLAFAWRAMLKIKHVPMQLFDVTFFPIMFVVLFTYLFGGALAGSPREYLQMLLPGILVMTVTFTTIYTGMALNNDIAKGVETADYAADVTAIAQRMKDEKIDLIILTTALKGSKHPPAYHEKLHQFDSELRRIARQFGFRVADRSLEVCRVLLRILSRLIVEDGDVEEFALPRDQEGAIPLLPLLGCNPLVGGKLVDEVSGVRPDRVDDRRGRTLRDMAAVRGGVAGEDVLVSFGQDHSPRSGRGFDLAAPAILPGNVPGLPRLLAAGTPEESQHQQNSDKIVLHTVLLTAEFHYPLPVRTNLSPTLHNRPFHNVSAAEWSQWSHARGLPDSPRGQRAYRVVR